MSGVVLDECAAGDPVAAAERLTAITSLGILPASAEADHLTRQFLRKNAFPPNEPRDAAHVSLAAVNGLEYLVTWNFRHIANAETRSLIESVCRESGYEPPTICTPDELPGA